MKRLLRLLLAPLLLAGAGFAVSQEQADPQSELGTVQEQITLSAAEQQRIAAEVAEVQADHDAISRKLVELGRTLQSQERAIHKAEEKIVQLTKREVIIRSTLAAKQETLSALLAGLQRLEQNPPPALAVEPKDVLSALRGAMMFGAIVPEMRLEAEQLANQLAELQQIRLNVETEKTSITASLDNLNASKAELDALVAQKQTLVSEGNARLSEEKARAAELASKAENLQQLLQSLADARKREAEEQAKALAAAEENKQKLAAAAEAERRRQAEIAARPRIAFGEAKGKLEYPSQGQIIRRFGDSDGLGGTLRGFAVAVGQGSQVIAPADGKVEFAGPFRSYGQLLIVNAGGDYLLLLAGMEKITAEMGQTIRAGEPVAVMGKGPSSVTLLGDKLEEARPVLYVELRKDGEAVDSTPWWIAGMKEANK